VLLEVVTVDVLTVTRDPVSVYVTVYVSVPVSPSSAAPAEAVVVLTLSVYGAYSGNSELRMEWSKNSLISSARSVCCELAGSGDVDGVAGLVPLVNRRCTWRTG